MTRKVFWEDPYQTVLDTTVATVSGPDITLEATILFAFSGGQDSDEGTIGGHQVKVATRAGREIVYTLEDHHGLRPGDAVRVQIDWARRYRLMRLHFAAELVLELAVRALQGVERVGAHITPDKARIDFVWPQSVSPLLPAIEQEANAIIAADLPIVCAFDDPATERRYWEIAGFSRVPCGGTHVRSTAEVGPIRLKRNNIGRGKERIEIHPAA